MYLYEITSIFFNVDIQVSSFEMKFGDIILFLSYILDISVSIKREGSFPAFTQSKMVASINIKLQGAVNINNSELPLIFANISIFFVSQLSPCLMS